MGQRIQKQARAAYNYFEKDILKGEIPKAINAVKFANYIARQQGYELKVVTVDIGNALRGMILTKENTTPKEALVFISNSTGNNICWKRFTLVKEICHLFLEHEKSIKNDCALETAEALAHQSKFLPNFLPSNGLGDQIREIVKKIIEEKTQILIGDDDPLECLMDFTNPIGAAETGAVVAAIEIMIPARNREWIGTQMSNGMNISTLAEQLKVPKLMLEHRLKEWFIEY